MQFAFVSDWHRWAGHRVRLQPGAELEVRMPLYRHPGATGRLDEITVIEDPDMVEADESGALRPSYAFIDRLTVKAHPLIMDALVQGSERLWSVNEVLASPESN
jgi:hypothetical protein